MSNSFLSQEEIDALLKQTQEGEKKSEDALATELTDREKDALGEIGNISMGSAATALSQLINQKVTITTPKVIVTTLEELLASFEVPYVVVEVQFTEGIQGSNLLIIKVSDAAVIADLMMGGDGKIEREELSDLELSALGEAMNQMIGSAATSMSSMLHNSIKITPPNVTQVSLDEDAYQPYLDKEAQVAVVYFKMVVGDLVNSEIMQVIPIDIAKKEAEMLLSLSFLEQDKDEPAEAVYSSSPNQPLPEPTGGPGDKDTAEAGTRNIDLILDVPLQISVVLGKTKKQIKEVLNLTSGSIVELEKLADEPVDILVNGTLIAQGEVVVVNENFGVKITNIIDPVERINNLRRREL
ncbi:flagellar motor switch phosphatase FliY [Calderihabitans maritimus]|uniref:CheC, inhibitor of MCP methylation / FliN fusion protein n=1 Tax=Calderihabitans maritimus TaxID=1246530 RepID=A0A1Z5HTU8_9FIRM|nr:flagellar motor switch phosphatase FliY [Calderihabitans maritimus]GAW92952.1 CheC, inhibitor of MCP methylation / FliN fusion protein [Calderihabitans maritimus]